MDLYSEKQERAETYELLARLFIGPPTEEAIESLRLYFGLETKDSMDAISTDFARLMKELPPYESANIIFTGRRLDTLDFYSRAGLTMDDELGLPADHLSVELLFMSYLVRAEMLDRQREFLEEHLLFWAPAYLERLAEIAQTGFYKDVALLTRDFLLSDYDRLME